MKELTNDEKARIISNAFDKFKGQITDFESSVGFFYLGFSVGWKPLYLLHSKRTVRKYEQILGIKVRDIFPEVGKDAMRLEVWKIAKSISNFWKVVSGDIPINKTKIID